MLRRAGMENEANPRDSWNVRDYFLWNSSGCFKSPPKSTQLIIFVKSTSIIDGKFTSWQKWKIRCSLNAKASLCKRHRGRAKRVLKGQDGSHFLCALRFFFSIHVALNLRRSTSQQLYDKHFTFFYDARFTVATEKCLA